MDMSKVFKLVGTLSGKEISFIFLASILLTIIFGESTSTFGVFAQYLAGFMLVFVYLIWPLALLVGIQSAAWQFKFDLESVALVIAITVIIGWPVFEAVTTINTEDYFENTFLSGVFAVSMFIGWSSLGDLFLEQRDNMYYRGLSTYKSVWAVMMPPIGAFVLRRRLDKYRLSKGWDNGPLVSDANRTDDIEASNQSSDSKGKHTKGPVYGPGRK